MAVEGIQFFSGQIIEAVSHAPDAGKTPFASPLLAEFAIYHFTKLAVVFEEKEQELAIKLVALIPEYLLKTSLGSLFLKKLEQVNRIGKAFYSVLRRGRGDIASYIYLDEERRGSVLGGAHQLLAFVPFQFLSQETKITFFSRLMENREVSERVMRRAVAWNKAEIVAEMFKRGADPKMVDGRGQNLVHLCITSMETKGKQTLLILLYRFGVSVKARDRDGYTPLRRAMEIGGIGVVVTLVDLKANYREEGLDEFALEKGNFTVACYLLGLLAKKGIATLRQHFLLHMLKHEEILMGNFFAQLPDRPEDHIWFLEILRKIPKYKRWCLAMLFHEQPEKMSRIIFFLLENPDKYPKRDEYLQSSIIRDYFLDKL